MVIYFSSGFEAVASQRGIKRYAPMIKEIASPLNM